MKFYRVPTFVENESNWKKSNAVFLISISLINPVESEKVQKIGIFYLSGVLAKLFSCRWFDLIFCSWELFIHISKFTYPNLTSFSSSYFLFTLTMMSLTELLSITRSKRSWATSVSLCGMCPLLANWPWSFWRPKTWRRWMSVACQVSQAVSWTLPQRLFHYAMF